VSKYLVVIERAGANYSAYIPDLPGVVAAADSPEEVRELMKEALAMHLDGMREDGVPVPEPTTDADWMETGLSA
jgi:predicted RNase H-like HicB family nuclease